MVRRGTVTVRADDFLCGPLSCGVDVSGSASFSSSGFEKATLSAAGIDLPDAGFLSFISSASAVVSYAVQTKSLSITPQFTLLFVDCLSFGTEIAWADNGVGDLRFTSIHVDHAFSNGVRLRMGSSLDPTDLTLNQTVTGYVDYWEVDTLSGEFGACGGIHGDWEVGVYFARPGVGTQLFDLGMFDLKASVDCGTAWELFTELSVRSGVFGDPTSEWLLGFSVAW